MAANALNKNNSGRSFDCGVMGRQGVLTSPDAAVKRIMQEARELANDPCTDYHAAPLEVGLHRLNSKILAHHLRHNRTISS